MPYKVKKYGAIVAHFGVQLGPFSKFSSGDTGVAAREAEKITHPYLYIHLGRGKKLKELKTRNRARKWEELPLLLTFLW